MYPVCRLNIKMSSYLYGNSNYKDKTVSRPPYLEYLHNGNPILVKTVFILVETEPRFGPLEHTLQLELGTYGIYGHAFGIMTHICVGEVGQRWYMQWLVARSAPSHYHRLPMALWQWDLCEQSSVKFYPKYVLGYIFCEENCTWKWPWNVGYLVSMSVWRWHRPALDPQIPSAEWGHCYLPGRCGAFNNNFEVQIRKKNFPPYNIITWQ